MNLYVMIDGPSSAPMSTVYYWIPKPCGMDVAGAGFASEPIHTICSPQWESARLLAGCKKSAGAIIDFIDHALNKFYFDADGGWWLRLKLVYCSSAGRGLVRCSCATCRPRVQRRASERWTVWSDDEC